MILYSHIKADFNNNEGGNGAAMAFYQESVIIILPFSSSYVNVHYHNNKALKLGGAIFVQDSDYMDIFTKKIGPVFMKLPEKEYLPACNFDFPITVLRWLEMMCMEDGLTCVDFL